MRHSLVFAIALLGCAEPKPPPGWGQKPVVVRPVAAPVVKKRLVIGRSGTPIGHLTTTTRAAYFGTRDDDAAAFVVEDGRYLSARWPGDAYLIAKRLLARL